MRRRISVGERLAEDFVEGGWNTLEGSENGIDALFGVLDISDTKLSRRNYIIVYVGVRDCEEAYRLANALVTASKAAHVRILPGVSSIFRDDTEVEEVEESLLVIKTIVELFQGVVDVVRSTCNFEVPEIIAVPAVTGSPDYSERVNAKVEPKVERRNEVKITLGDIEINAWLNGTDTAARILEALPITSRVSMWGDEIYFPVQVERVSGNGKSDTVNIGDIAYWPPGKAISIFLGGTPLGGGEKIRPLTPVEVIGRMEAPRSLPGRVKQGEKIIIQKSS